MTTVKIHDEAIKITKAMVSAVKSAERFYRGEGLNHDCLCSAAMDTHKAFDAFWDKIGAICGCDEERFIRALKREVWKK